MRRTLTAIAIAATLLPIKAARPCSYLPGYSPGWVEPSTADHLSHADGVVVALVLEDGGKDLWTRHLRIEEVLKGPSSLRGKETIYSGPFLGMCGFSRSLEPGRRYLVLLEHKVNSDAEAKDQWSPIVASPGRLDGPLTSVDDLKAIAAKLLLDIRGPPITAAGIREKARTTSAAEVRNFLDDLAEEHAHAVSPYKSFAELRTLFDSGDSVLRARVLDAMTRGKMAEGLPLARAVLEDRKGAETVASAVRYVVARHDTGSLRAIVRIFREWSPTSGSQGDFLAAIESGTLGRHGLIEAIVELAAPGDAATVFAVLSDATDEEAISLASGYFSRNPHPAAVADLRLRVQGRYQEKWPLALALASLGDESVLRWALARVDDPLPPAGRFRRIRERRPYFLPTYIVGRSPLPEARKKAEGLLEGGGQRAKWIRESRRHEWP